MKKTTINLNDIQIKDLDGNVQQLPTLAKHVGNHVYKHSVTIEVNDIARDIHAGKPVEVNEHELQEIIAIITKAPGIALWISRQIGDHLTKLQG